MQLFYSSLSHHMSCTRTLPLVLFVLDVPQSRKYPCGRECMRCPGSPALSQRPTLSWLVCPSQHERRGSDAPRVLLLSHIQDDEDHVRRPSSPAPTRVSPTRRATAHSPTSPRPRGEGSFAIARAIGPYLLRNGWRLGNFHRVLCSAAPRERIAHACARERGAGRMPPQARGYAVFCFLAPGTALTTARQFILLRRFSLCSAERLSLRTSKYMHNILSCLSQCATTCR
jgi:hypothetical protein